MPKLLEGHSRPIAQSIVATGLWELFYRGVPSLVTWYVAHQFSVGGWAWPWAILFAAIAFCAMSIGFHFLFRRTSGTNSSAEASESPSLDHSECERNVRNLQTRLSMMTQRETTYGVQLSARDGQIEQLQAELDGFKWLRDIASEEAEKISRFVSIVDCDIAHHEFFRHDPYVEFSIKVWNRSVFDVALPDLTGAISYHRRELTGLLEWKERPREVTRGNQAFFTFRQRLTSDDVAHILNENTRFQFGELEIRAEGLSERSSVASQRISVDVPPPNNQALLNAYPKLKIDAKVLLATMIVNHQTWNTEPPDALVNLALTIRNYRSVSVSVDSFQLEVTVDSVQSTVYAETGELSKKLYVSGSGQLTPMDRERLPHNLAERLPLAVRQAQIIGHVQFIVPGMGAMILNHPASFRLIFIDTTGEKHTVEGLTGRREVEQVEIKKGDESR